MARTKASRLSQAGRRGVDAGVGDTTRTAREGAAFPPPAQEPSERESLARACPETPSTSDSPPTQPPTSADRASDDDARVARSPRDAFAALVAPRATRRAPVRDRPTDNLPGVHAASGVPALARQAPRRNPESRRRQRRAPCASRDTSTVRPTSARARAPAPTRPLRHPFQRVAFLGRAEEGRRSQRRPPSREETRRDPPVEYLASAFPRASFLPHPRVPCLPPWTGFRFTKAERALLVSVFERYEGKTPDRATCDAIARAFTRSPCAIPAAGVAAPPADEAPRAKHARAPANVPRSTPSSPFVSLLGTTFHIPTASAAPVRIPSGDARLDARISPSASRRRGSVAGRRTRPTLRRGRRRRRFASRRRFESFRRAPPSRRVGRRHHARLGVADVSVVRVVGPDARVSDPAIFDDDVEDGRARDDENTKREHENVPSASSDGGASGGGDEWDVRPRALEREERGERHPDASLRPEAEASLARSYSLASLPLAIDDATRRDAAAVAKRDIAEWQPAGTSLYVGARANAFAFARPRRPSSPSPRAAAAGSRDARAVPPGTTERLGVRGFRGGGGGGDGRRRARLCLGGGMLSARASRLRFDGANSRLDRPQWAARDEDDGARGFDALSEGDDVERSIKLSDELSDEDEESVDVRPYAPGVSLEALVRARDDDLTATLARGGRTGRWVPLRPSGGIGAARAAGARAGGRRTTRTRVRRTTPRWWRARWRSSGTGRRTRWRGSRSKPGSKTGG